jgi:hypothetical protein
MSNAFDALQPRETKADKAHRVAAGVTVEGDGVDGTLVLRLPIVEIAKSKKSNGEKGAIGFMFDPVEFTVNGRTFSIKPGWTTLSAKS